MADVRSANLLIKPLFIKGFFIVLRFYSQLDPQVFFQTDGRESVLIMKKQSRGIKVRSNQNRYKSDI